MVRAISRTLDVFLIFVGECILLLLEAIRKAFRQPTEWRETLAQMAFVGVASLPIVLLTSFFSGAVLCFYLSRFLGHFEIKTFVGATVGLSAVKEIIPILTGTTVAARCGSAMAAQIGTMAVTEQIDALKMLSVNPTKYLVTPRIVASMLMMPALCLGGIYCCLGGAYLIAINSGIPAGTFISSIQQYTSPADLARGVLKTPVFGLIIALVACQQGLRTKDGAVGVGKATTNAVVVSIVLIYIADFLIATYSP